jgi:hypothetical protein
MTVVAWPPPVPPNSRQNVTPIVDAHPADHNKIADALDTIIAKMPLGHLAYVEQTAAQSNIQTTTVDLTSLTITFTLTTQRRVRLDASIWFTKSAPDTAGMAFAQIATGANVEVQGRGTYMSAPGYGTVVLSKTLLLAPGTYTYKARASTGAGFLNTASNASEPSVLQAIDLGSS